jgi:acyl-CoA reductase-like NAD-dependent aldehyde dehydrogenase
MMDSPSRCYIDGEAAPPAALLPVTNPATGQVFAEAATASGAQVEMAIRAARRAFDSGVWSGLPAGERERQLARFLDILDARSGVLTATLVTETGCPVGLAGRLQVRGAIDQVRAVPRLFAGLPEFTHTPVPLTRLAAGGRVALSVMTYEPVGVVAAIAACNFPLYTALWKVVPALMTGCTVVLRPSPLTPLATLAIGEAAAEAGLPPGVLNVVAEDGIEGARMLTEHAEVDAVSFTGSASAGVAVAQQCAPTMKRAILELGGKSVQLYLPGLPGAADRAVGGALSVLRTHAGQGCSLPTRILVPREAEPEVLAGLRTAVPGIRVGDPADPGTEMGPVVSESQLARCAHYVGAAVEAGAEIVAGGGRVTSLGPGYYFEPTVLRVPDNKNPAAQEEIFGPVLTVMAYDTVDEAVDIANDSSYGLSGAVHGPADQGIAVARRLRTGSVIVNGGVSGTPHVSFGGWKRSGIGRERGAEGLRAYQHAKHITAVS